MLFLAVLLPLAAGAAVCETRYGEVFLATRQVPFGMAEHVCRENGGTLANIAGLERESAAGREVLAGIDGMLGDCGVCGGSPWVSTLEPGICLEYAGGLVSRTDCSQLRPVLCQVHAAEEEAGWALEAGEKTGWTPALLERKARPRRGCVCPPPKPTCMPDSNNSQCVCASSSTGTMVDCCCKYRLVTDYDFFRSYPMIGTNWSYYSRGNYTADGGRLVLTRHGGLLNTSRYNTTVPQNPDLYLDNYKYLILADQAIDLPMDGDMVFQYMLHDAYSYLARADQVPFPVQIVSCPGQDFRMASTVVMLQDPDYGFQFSYILTTDMVYAVYARLPDHRAELGNYAAFTFLYPVRYRLPSDEHKLKIVVSARMRSVRWQIGTRDVFRVMNVGSLVDRQYMTLDLGGAETVDRFPARLQYGLGSMDFVNHYPACYRTCADAECCFPMARQALVKTGSSRAYQQWDPQLGKDFPATFWDVNGRPEYRLWGQGSAATFTRLTVYWQDCKYRFIHAPRPALTKQPRRFAKALVLED